LQDIIEGAPSMEKITTVGIDLAKNVFQVHAIDASGAVIVSRAIRRAGLLQLLGKFPACLIGMEACATSHHWARELTKLGHQVKLIPPAYVKAYVRRQKNDAADAAAICEAVGRPSMRFVPVKTVDQQAALMLHRTRALLVAQRTALICALRSHMAEFGIVAPVGPRNVAPLLAILADEADGRLTALARAALRPLARRMTMLKLEIERLDRRLLDWHRSSPVSQRLATIPGVGPLTATALAASIADPSMFRSGREFAAFLGLVPRQASSGGKERLGRISKMGDRYLRTLFVVGATAVLRHAKAGGSSSRVWAEGLLAKKPFKLVAVALANKTARIAWAVMARGEAFRDGIEVRAAA
jgi:transposase